MAHTHDVYDMENHFEINGSSRFIKETSETKLVVVQGDHKSEVLTFKMPRYIDGHDMTLCNKIRIHYINLDTKTNNKSADVYEVTDLTLCEECEDVLTFTWTIEAPATKYSGTLSFLVKFECTEGENVLYQWNTAKYVSVNVLAGIDNGEEFVDKYSNVLEEWYNELTRGADTIEELNQQALAEIEIAKEDAKKDIQKHSNDTYEEFISDVNKKAEETLESIPEDYTALTAEVSQLSSEIEEKTSELKETLDNKFKYGVVVGSQSRNRFNKNSVEVNKYIQYTTGDMLNANGYSASDFIDVMPNETITLTYCDQCAFYDNEKVFISGLPNNSLSGGNYTITVPNNANFFRTSILTSQLDTYQIVSGEVMTEYETHDNKISADNVRKDEKIIDEGNLAFDFKGKVRDYSNQFMDFRSKLNNPFKSTKIKFLGDSITAGQGASNYSSTKEYGKADYVADDMSINCYANLVRRYLHSTYGVEQLLSMADENIKILNSAKLYEDTQKMLNWFVRCENTKIEKVISFVTDSSEFTLYTNLGTNRGMFQIYVDGVFNKNIDCYHSTELKSYPVKISGLSSNKKTIEIRSSGVKNTSSSNTRFDIEGIAIKKTVTTKNYGVSGYNSKDILDRVETLVESDDDIVLLQVGTNDRGYTSSTSEMETYYNKLVDYILQSGKNLIVMSAPPVSEENENADVQNFNMADVNRTIAKVSDKKQIPFISNYNHFERLFRYKDWDTTNVLADGIHPNDLGYEELAKNVIEKLLI